MWFFLRSLYARTRSGPRARRVVITVLRRRSGFSEKPSEEPIRGAVGDERAQIPETAAHGQETVVAVVRVPSQRRRDDERHDRTADWWWAFRPARREKVRNDGFLIVFTRPDVSLDLSCVASSLPPSASGPPRPFVKSPWTYCGHDAIQPGIVRDNRFSKTNITITTVLFVCVLVYV